LSGYSRKSSKIEVEGETVYNDEILQSRAAKTNFIVQRGSSFHLQSHALQNVIDREMSTTTPVGVTYYSLS
jgi:hypothetical protein